MPDPLDDMAVSPDAARSEPNLDPTGIGPAMEVLGAAWQINTAARVCGFSEAQAFDLAKSWFITMARVAAERDG